MSTARPVWMIVAWMLAAAGVAAAAAPTPSEFPVGTAIERVPTQSDPAKSFALYLPSRFTPDRKRALAADFDRLFLLHRP